MKCFKRPSIYAPPSQKGKPYFVFFSFGGKYYGYYAEVRARSLEQARNIAWKRYGVSEVGRVEHNIERAFAHIAAYKLLELQESQEQQQA